MNNGAILDIAEHICLLDSFDLYGTKDYGIRDEGDAETVIGALSSDTSSEAFAIGGWDLSDPQDAAMHRDREPANKC